MKPKFFTVKDIQDILEKIECLKSSYDNEAAHELEDELYVNVLMDIANGAPNPVELAKEAVKANSIEFVRYYI